MYLLAKFGGQEYRCTVLDTAGKKQEEEQAITKRDAFQINEIN